MRLGKFDMQDDYQDGKSMQQFLLLSHSISDCWYICKRLYQ